MVTINIQKKDLFLLTAIFVFLVGAGFVIAYDHPSNDPKVVGHSAEELEGVCLSDGTNCNFAWSGGGGISSCVVKSGSNGAVSCDVGEIRTGGGCYFTGGQNSDIRFDYPVGTDSWSCGDTDLDSTAYAVCCT